MTSPSRLSINGEFIHSLSMLQRYMEFFCYWVLLILIKLLAYLSKYWGVHICTFQMYRLNRMGIPEVSAFQNYVSETRSWICNRFLLHVWGKNEFIIFISAFLIKSLMPISRTEHSQISASAKLRIGCMFEQHTVDLWQINSLEMGTVYIWLTSS